MLRLTLHQMRTGWARLLAAGIAIMLGAGFVAASLLAGNVMSSATAQSVTAQYRGADLVVSGAQLTESAVTAVDAADGVASTHLIVQSGMELGSGARAQWGLIGVRPPQDSAGSLTSGSLPTASDGVALTEGAASRLGAKIGDTVTITSYNWENADDDPAESSAVFTVTGLLADATNFFNYTADGLVTIEAMRVLAPQDSRTGELALTLDGDADAAQVTRDLRQELGDGATIHTVDEVAAATISRISGDTDPLTALLLAFAGIALVVAVLVIGNTFSVLVAQRTRLLALLRTIGATRAQVRRSVLLEAILLGVVAALAGLALGYGVVAGAIAFLTPILPGIDLWQGAGLTGGIVITTLAVGVVVTLVAGWVPSRAATRVKPLAALRPEPVQLSSTAGKARATVSIAAVVLGGALLVGGILLAGTMGDGPNNTILLLALAMGILGGFLSVFGVLFGAVFLINAAVRVVGAVFGRGATARLAVENSLRNPRRTAATTNALFIGVALVVLMATGAASAKATFDDGLASYFPVDVQITAVDGQALTPGQIDTATRIDGIAASTLAASVAVQLSPAPGVTGGNTFWGDVVAPVTGDVLADPTLLTDLAPGEIAIDSGRAAVLRASEGDMIQVEVDTAQRVALPGGSSEAGEPGGPDQDANRGEFTVGRITPGGDLAVTLPETLQGLAPETPVNTLWLKLDPDANALSVVRDLQDALSDLQASDPNAPLLSVEGTAVERSTFGDVIDTMLLVVLALLAVAIVIALVGVANTLSLSVIERRRESATLRALGLTKKQLRGMLAIEGVLIAVVGAAVGVLGGLGYGWAGSWILLSGIGTVHLAVPWMQIGWIVVIAIVAGLVASVLPSRSAVKVPPVAALAEE